MLAMYDGESDNRIYVAVSGIVYEVTERRDLYGYGARYILSEYCSPEGQLFIVSHVDYMIVTVYWTKIIRGRYAS